MVKASLRTVLPQTELSPATLYIEALGLVVLNERILFRRFVSGFIDCAPPCIPIRFCSRNLASALLRLLSKRVSCSMLDFPGVLACAFNLTEASSGSTCFISPF